MASLIPANEFEEVLEIDPPESLSSVQRILGCLNVTPCRFVDDEGGSWFWSPISSPSNPSNNRVAKWIKAPVPVHGMCLFMSKRETAGFPPNGGNPLVETSWWKFSKFRAEDDSENLDLLVASFKPRPKWGKP